MLLFFTHNIYLLFAAFLAGFLMRFSLPEHLGKRYEMHIKLYSISISQSQRVTLAKLLQLRVEYLRIQLFFPFALRAAQIFARF